jgi:hypothetical protein
MSHINANDIGQCFRNVRTKITDLVVVNQLVRNGLKVVAIKQDLKLRHLLICVPPHILSEHLVIMMAF